MRVEQANVSKQLGMLLGAGVISRQREGNHAIYSIRMPMVFELCNLVCRGVAEHAEQNAAALRGAPSRAGSPGGGSGGG